MSSCITYEVLCLHRTTYHRGSRGFLQEPFALLKKHSLYAMTAKDVKYKRPGIDDALADKMLDSLEHPSTTQCGIIVDFQAQTFEEFVAEAANGCFPYGLQVAPHRIKPKRRVFLDHISDNEEKFSEAQMTSFGQRVQQRLNTSVSSSELRSVQKRKTYVKKGVYDTTFVVCINNHSIEAKGTVYFSKTD